MQHFHWFWPLQFQNLRKFSAETDEGVDLNENPKCIYPTDVLTSKCPFYDDCFCISDSDVMDSDNTSSSSLNSGSEFEEFVSVKGTTIVFAWDSCLLPYLKLSLIQF